MPLLLGIPIIAALGGLFAGSIIQTKADNSTAPVGGGVEGNNSLPVYVTVPLIVGGIILALVIVKKITKKL